MTRVWAPLLGAFVYCVAPAAAQDSTTVLMKRTAAEDLQLFSQVFNQIRVNHPDSLDTHGLYMAAIEGMVRAADPHSYLIPAVRLSPEIEQAYRKGDVYPVPVDFSYVGGSPVVMSVAAGTLAARQDILRGDELIQVDGKPIKAASALELDISLAGKKGSTAELTLLRRRSDGSQVELKRSVRRERADPASAVATRFLLDATTGYIRVTTFAAENVARDMADAIQALEAAGMRQLILDLRDNGGGSVDEAARVAGAFLPAGATVYSTVGRKADITSTGKVQRAFWKSEKRFPVTVLINAGTASAAEMVSGALQDHDRALIVGRPSFGKALLMQTMPMSDGSWLALVIGHVKTPCGRVIQRQYRDVTTRDYYRMAGAQRELAGRPECKTSKGRTVYGGGGIVPDVVLPERNEPPSWLARAFELDLPLRWTGGYLTDHPTSLPEAISPEIRLPATARTAFVSFAAQAGVMIPADNESNLLLDRVLLAEMALAKWGTPGYYQVVALFDSDVLAARAQGRAAAQLLNP